MAYYAKTQQGILVVLAAIVLLTTTIKIKGYDGEILYLQIAVLLFLFISVFIKFKFTINEDNLTYQIIFLTFSIYQKKIRPSQIKQLKFTRVGWAKKEAVIQLESGFNIRVAHFEPNDLYADLMDFANKHSIIISKTKDYLILEKLK